ncbi:MAG TPA: hypothetical protein VHM70_20540 [Polyangiaceae bacterium]|jgi:hypothetical protein|nr:hypothetical protein [Polyangiaceae bacterium]
MRLIVLNLLHRASRAAGCEQETWDVVTEFGVAEGLIDGTIPDDDMQSAGRTSTFLAAAEALLNCMTGDWGTQSREKERRNTLPPN